jgi:hypothetical protein
MLRARVLAAVTPSTPSGRVNRQWLLCRVLSCTERPRSLGQLSSRVAFAISIAPTTVNRADDRDQRRQRMSRTFHIRLTYSSNILIIINFLK